MAIRVTRAILAVLLLGTSVGTGAAPVGVAGGTAAAPTDITAYLLADRDLDLTGGHYVVRIPRSGAGVVAATSVDSRIASILTTTVFFAGLTRIDRNVVLQLGDGTTGNNAPRTLTFGDGRTVTFPYSDSSGNGMLMTRGNEALLPLGEGREGTTAQVRYEIANDGKLIVDNTPGALDATTAGASAAVAAWVAANRLDGITGSGSVEQRGTLALTLGAPGGNPNSYTGGTIIARGATLIAGSATAFGRRDGAAGGASGGVVNHGTLQAAPGVRTIVVPGDFTQGTMTAATVPARSALPGGGALVLAGVAAAGRRRRTTRGNIAR